MSGGPASGKEEDSGFMVKSVGCRGWSLELRDEGLGCRVEGVGLTVKDPGCRDAMVMLRPCERHGSHGAAFNL